MNSSPSELNNPWVEFHVQHTMKTIIVNFAPGLGQKEEEAEEKGSFSLVVLFLFPRANFLHSSSVIITTVYYATRIPLSHRLLYKRKTRHMHGL